jgi:serine/threonine protein kinase
LVVELMTRRAPLGDGDDAQLEAATRDPKVRPTPRARGRDLGGHVEAIFERALAVNPADRYATMESFWSALRAASRWTLRARSSTVPPPLSQVEAPPPASSFSPPLSQVDARPARVASEGVLPCEPAREPARVASEGVPPCEPAREPPANPLPSPVSHRDPHRLPSTVATLPAVAAPPLPIVKPATPPKADPIASPRAAEAVVTRPATPRPSPPPIPPPPKSPPAPSRQAAVPMRSQQLSDPGADDPEIGSVIAGKYCIERLLGRGGMGSVWLCRHLGLGERVAVKLMCRKLAADPDVRARFEREARAAARIKSRYVARVYDTGELPDLRPYIVMEYMEGETLAQALLRSETLSLADTVRILGQVGRGLARAHELGIVHRDIKPDNVFLAHTADDGVVAKVFDFGIVKVAETPNDGATRDGVLIGTPQYMSPEQADGLAIDHRSDIYSLGVVAFRMLTGRRPFNADSVLGILIKICNSPLPSLAEHVPGLPPAVDVWFRRACARDRAWRFNSVVECVEALAKAAGVVGAEPLRDVSVLPPPPSLQATTPHEQSCPTLLDDVADVLVDEPSGSFVSASASAGYGAEGPVSNLRREPFRTNPLFDGEPSVVPESTLPPHALDRNPPPRQPRGFWWRAAFAAIVGGLSFVGLVYARGLPGRATVSTRQGAVGAAANVAPLAPPAPPPPPAITSVPNPPNSAQPAKSPPAAAPSVDAGLPTFPPSRPGRSRRGTSATSR